MKRNNINQQPDVVLGEPNESGMPSMHLMPQWVARMIEDCEEEVDNDKTWPLKLLTKEARMAIWGLCTVLGVRSHGVPGQACRLVERYLAAQMRAYARVPMDSDEWLVVKRSLASRLTLIMVSCIQLAAKMSRADMDFSANVVRAVLGCSGVVFTVNELKHSEFQVFSMLGFRVPLWSSVDAGLALAVEVGMPQMMLEGVTLFVNLCELRRDKLDRRVRWAANLENVCDEYKRGTLRTLHMCAGSVLACSRYLGFILTSDPGPRLAELTRVPLCYLRCVGDVILRDMTVGDAEDSGTPMKRKSSAIPDFIDTETPCKHAKD